MYCKPIIFNAGVLREVAQRVFKLDINLTITGRTQRSVQMSTGMDRVEEHVIFLIEVLKFEDYNPKKFSLPQVIVDENLQRKARQPWLSDTVQNRIYSKALLSEETAKMTNYDFCEALPYHVIFDEQCRLIQCGHEI